MCDAFLVLAQAPGGLTCFLLPRVLPDGDAQRLPHRAAQGQAREPLERVRRDRARRRVGDAARRGGPRDPRRSSRWSCTRGSTACSARPRSCAARSPRRRTTQRTASRFGRLLAEQPLHLNVLADLCLDSEAATATALRLARAVDEGDHAFRRLATTVAKYWVCKTTPPLVAEALECLGGNGYVEESVLPRLLPREPAQLAVGGRGERQRARPLARGRARARERRGAARRDRARRGRRRAARRGRRAAPSPSSRTRTSREYRARRVAELAALCLQGSLLVRHAPPEVADAFCATRLGGEGGRATGRCRAASTAPRSSSAHRPQLGS